MKLVSLQNVIVMVTAMDLIVLSMPLLSDVNAFAMATRVGYTVSGAVLRIISIHGNQASVLLGCGTERRHAKVFGIS